MGCEAHFDPMPLGVVMLVCRRCGRVFTMDSYPTFEFDAKSCKYAPVCDCLNGGITADVKFDGTTFVMADEFKMYFGFKGFEEVEPYRTKDGYTSTWKVVLATHKEKAEKLANRVNARITMTGWDEMEKALIVIAGWKSKKKVDPVPPPIVVSKKFFEGLGENGFYAVYSKAPYIAPKGGFKVKNLSSVMNTVAAEISAKKRADKIARIKEEGRIALRHKDVTEVNGLLKKLARTEKMKPTTWISHEDFEEYFSTVAGGKFSMDRGTIREVYNHETGEVKMYYYDPVKEDWVESDPIYLKRYIEAYQEDAEGNPIENKDYTPVASTGKLPGWRNWADWYKNFNYTKAERDRLSDWILGESDWLSYLG